MTTLLKRTITHWLPLAVATTGIFGFAYLVGQQSYRQSLNDPQIQMAEDAAAALASGDSPTTVVPFRTTSVDIRASLEPWIAVFDASGSMTESYAGLDNESVHLPVGLFDPNTWAPLKHFSAPTGPETRVTWEPRPDVRQAVVLVQYQIPSRAGAPAQTGWVAVGRSMRVVEDHIIDLTKLAGIAWSITLVATFATLFFLITLGLL